MITDKVIIELINKMLHERYRVLDGRPIYRLVWSADELELRKGTYSEFYGSIFIRQTTSVKWIKKYWNYTNPRWVLEKLVFIHNKHQLKEMQEELVLAYNGSYEPVYSFINKSDEPLPVVWEVVEYILWKLQNPAKTNPFLAQAAMEAEEAAEVAYFEEQLHEGERSPLFVWENSAFVSSNQLAYRKSLTYTEKIDAETRPSIGVRSE